MPATSHQDEIETLLAEGAWEQARTHIESALLNAPDNHWLLTQLGVTYYEQHRYRESLEPFLKSLKIVRDCPLTLWNLAGAVDALGNSKTAIQIYTWLLKSKKSAADDPCWEGPEWTASLKTDCVYRLGLSFHRLENWSSSKECFHHYINLILAGMHGTYSIQEAAKYILEGPRNGMQSAKKNFRDALDSILHIEGIENVHGKWKVSKLSTEELLTP